MKSKIKEYRARLNIIQNSIADLLKELEVQIEELNKYKNNIIGNATTTDEKKQQIQNDIDINEQEIKQIKGKADRFWNKVFGVCVVLFILCMTLAFIFQLPAAVIGLYAFLTLLICDLASVYSPRSSELTPSLLKREILKRQKQDIEFLEDYLSERKKEFEKLEKEIAILEEEKKTIERNISTPGEKDTMQNNQQSLPTRVPSHLVTGLDGADSNSFFQPSTKPTENVLDISDEQASKHNAHGDTENSSSSTHSLEPETTYLNPASGFSS